LIKTIEKANTTVSVYSPMSDLLESMPPIVFYDLKALNALGRTPRSPDDNGIQVRYDQLDRDNCVFVFVSHCWLRGWPGAKGWRGRPHPDTPKHDKFRLLLNALKKAMTTLAPGMDDCFVWIDYGCINQDASACLELKMLDKIIGVCDLIITPIYDSSGKFKWYDQISTVSNWYDQYGSPSWNQGRHSYLARGWCRLEMFYAANIPLEHNSHERIAKLNAGLLSSAKAGRRPHLLYGSCEEKLNAPILILPPLQNSWFDRYNPMEGSLTKEEDRASIKFLVENLLIYMPRATDGYEGEKKGGKAHGVGIYSFDDGDVYTGRWKDGKMFGQGTYTSDDGTILEGEWKDGKMHGHGTCRSADGTYYEGAWERNQKHGMGIERYINGDSYEGMFKLGKKHGYGTYKYADGATYIGDWRDDESHSIRRLRAPGELGRRCRQKSDNN